MLEWIDARERLPHNQGDRDALYAMVDVNGQTMGMTLRLPPGDRLKPSEALSWRVAYWLQLPEMPQLPQQGGQRNERDRAG